MNVAAGAGLVSISPSNAILLIPSINGKPLEIKLASSGPPMLHLQLENVCQFMFTLLRIRILGYQPRSASSTRYISIGLAICSGMSLCKIKNPDLFAGFSDWLIHLFCNLQTG